MREAEFMRQLQIKLDRVNEQQLTELAFIPPALVTAWSAFWGSTAVRSVLLALETYFTVDGAREILSEIERINRTPEQLTPEDWFMLVMQILVTRFAFKWAREDLKELLSRIPPDTRRQIGDWLKSRFMPLMDRLRKNS